MPCCDVYIFSLWNTNAHFQDNPLVIVLIEVYMCLQCSFDGLLDTFVVCDRRFSETFKEVYIVRKCPQITKTVL